ncbi:MAG: tetratricopeptide repeat protein, partial [Acidobacteriota bacterium]
MIICQFCAATNPPDAEVCHACGQRLLIVSGEVSEDEQIAFEGGAEEQMSFDEHLLERISVLEEAVKQTARASQTILGMLHDLEQKSLVGQTGVAALRDLLERKALVTRDEWSELWESRMDRQLLALEKRQRFAAARGAMLDLSSAEPRDAFAALLDEAHRQLVDLDVDGALRTLDGAFRLDPDNPELAFFLGETAFNRERGAAAVEYFSRVLKTRPEHYESLIYSGVLLHEAGDDAIAEARLLDAVDRYPDEALPAFALGGLYVGRGRPVDAVDHLERAMGAMGSVPQAALLLADCQLRLERPRLAAAAARAAVAHDPSDVEAHLLFAAAALELSWWRKASDALSTAQHLRPARLSYRALLALA